MKSGNTHVYPQSIKSLLQTNQEEAFRLSPKMQALFELSPEKQT